MHEVGRGAVLKANLARLSRSLSAGYAQDEGANLHLRLTLRRKYTLLCTEAQRLTASSICR